MKSKKIGISIAIGIILVISFLAVNEFDLDQPEPVDVNEQELVEEQIVEITFEIKKIKLDDVTILVQLADTPEKSSLGLQFQEKLPYDEGMLFDFGNSRNLGMWMPNMKFSLDMIFFDEEGKVVSITENVPPCIPNENCTSIKSKSKARYVLEVTSGFVDQFNITSSSQLDLSSLK